MPFVAVTGEQTPRKLIEISTAVNAALRGETYNIGVVSVPSGSSSVTIHDYRCGTTRLAFLVPMNAAAANVRWYVSDIKKGEMTFTFTAATTAECKFGWIIEGTGAKA